MRRALFVIGLLILAGCGHDIDEPSENERFIIAACPSMVALFEGFDDDTVTVVSVRTSAHAFEALHSGEVDAALTGRPPTRAESNTANTLAIRKGATLLAENPRVALVTDLSDLHVAICVDDYPEGVVRPLPCESYPDETDHRIVDWESWNEEPFVTVVDGADKSLLFRGIYLTGSDTLETLEPILTTHLEESS